MLEFTGDAVRLGAVELIILVVAVLILIKTRNKD